MTNSRKLALLFFVLVLLLGGAYMLYDNLSGSVQPQAAQQTAQAGEEQLLAPDFTVYDAQGEAVSLSQLRGKPVVLNFWSSRCGPCQAEMPAFQQLWEELGDEVHFMLVNVTDGSWDTHESAMAFIEEEGYTLPVYYDLDLTGSNDYGARRSLPLTFFLDAEGYLVTYANGMLSRELLLKGIELIG